jgi:hypothetical protein
LYKNLKIRILLLLPILLALLFSYTPANSIQDPPFYYPSGPQQNIDKSVVESGGWTLCWSGTYGGTDLLSPLLPITYKFKILGCSGIRRWDSFRILGIPERYATSGIWQITEVEHGLSGMQWVTEITGTYRQLQ